MSSTSPRLIVFAGLPGVGKSALAGESARSLGASWLRVDAIEAAILKAGIAPSFETGLAAYLVAREIADERLSSGADVVIDAVNGVEPARQMWRELARAVGARRFVIEVSCPDAAEHERRVRGRPVATPPLRNPTWEEVVRREYVPWAEPVLRLDGTLPPSENLSRILRYCGGSEARP